jgi:hypothetical protein
VPRRSILLVRLNSRAEIKPFRMIVPHRVFRSEPIKTMWRNVHENKFPEWTVLKCIVCTENMPVNNGLGALLSRAIFQSSLSLRVIYISTSYFCSSGQNDNVEGEEKDAKNEQRCLHSK